METEAQEQHREAKPVNETAKKDEEIIDVDDEAKEYTETVEDNEYVRNT